MRIALAQINPTLGDFALNSGKIVEFSQRARDKHADIVIFSEMSLCGYPPYDLLERTDVVKMQLSWLQKTIRALPSGVTVVFGAVTLNSHYPKGGKPYCNSAVVARQGTKPLFFHKQLLPSYDVFDDTRFFEPGTGTGLVRIPGVGRVAVTICEDMWARGTDANYVYDPLAKVKNVDLIVNISASPFSKLKSHRRLLTAKKHAKQVGVPFAYVNQLGGQDELIFDGRSFLLDQKGKLIVQAALCEEDLVIIDMKARRSEHRPQEEEPLEILRRVLVMGLRDFLKKSKLNHVHLGLSGGIDSSLVACLAVDALGPSHVKGLLLPGPFSSQGSIDDSVILAKNLGIETQTVGVSEIYEAARKLSASFGGMKDPGKNVGIVEQNLQARLRGMLLMAYSNATGSMLLATSNKSELATGYTTLYGDSCGGLVPIGDLTKHEVYRLAQHYNRGREIIPEEILMKAPSAELAPGQTDQDTLPPYDQLDKAVIHIVERKKNPTNEIEKWLLLQGFKTEFKRWQSPPILRVSDRAFGRGRRFPLCHQFSP